MLKHRNLYNVEICEPQCMRVQIVASSKTEARNKMREILKKTTFTPDDTDWIYFDDGACCRYIELLEEDTEEEDIYPDWGKEGR